MNLKNLFVWQNTMKYNKTNGHKSEHEWINESVLQDSMVHSFPWSQASQNHYN